MTAHYGLNDELFVATITDRPEEVHGLAESYLAQQHGNWNNIFTVKLRWI